MFAKSNYRRKLFFYFFVVFVFFTLATTAYQYNREKKYRIRQLENILDTYTEFVDTFTGKKNIYHSGNFYLLDSLMQIMPRKDIRITLIDSAGLVIFDSFVDDYSGMDNHLNRPEIQESMHSPSGASIRKSASTGQDYYYYAKKYSDHFIRAAVVYTVDVQQFLKTEHIFIYFILLLFFTILFLLLYVSDRLGKSLIALKDFSIRAGKAEDMSKEINFPDNELGVIGRQIMKIYDDLQKSNRELSSEREKLMQHLQISNEGIGVYSEDDDYLFGNNTYVTYLNLLCDKPTITPDRYQDINELNPVVDFVRSIREEELDESEGQFPMKKISIEKNKRYYDVHCLVFADKSYEISIIDMTMTEKQKILKQQMTANIAHELKTPVSVIKAYLETIITSSDLPHDQLHNFIAKASIQINRLSDLIRDIAMLTKMEEAADLYEIEQVDIRLVAEEVIENLQAQLDKAMINVELNIFENTVISGNSTLIRSIFQNLLENTINYAGENIKVYIDQYLEDDMNYYFAFSDTGVGIKKKHQARIFERFYRLDMGRSRKQGGTGLGLAIVKNAVQFHKGEISVKSRKKGGVEFIFSMAKE